MTNMLACPSCGLDKTESIVHRGSYILRCAACGEAIVATSFMAMLDSDHQCSAFTIRVPENTLRQRRSLRGDRSGRSHRQSALRRVTEL
ncbi:putative Zn finger protein [Rhizobium beringeri]